MPDITMPQLGETVTEGTITRWIKQVGDKVEEDEVLYEVSTDKVDSEVPSPFSGYLTEIVVPEGETAPVGAKLAVIGDAPSGNGSGAAPAAEASAPAEAPAPGGAPAPEPPPAPSKEEQAADPLAATKAQAAGQPETEQPKAPEAAVAQAASEQKPGAQVAVEAPSAPSPSHNGDVAGGGPGGGGATGGKVLSPVVRKLISENNLDAGQIPGTGAGGRITRSDVLDFLDKGGAGRTAPATVPTAPTAPASQPSTAPAAAPARQAPAPVAIAQAGERDTVVPFSNIRKRTAEHMVRSLATSAHTLVVIEVDYENVDKVRRAQKNKFKAEEGFSLSYLPFIARATVDAIREFPHVNATVGDNELIVHNYVNLGFAVDLSFEGLIVPVVHDADGKRMRAVARELTDLATRARNKKLTADDISGGTFTITNAGGYGTLITAPVINQPQVAILSTDGVKPKPVAVPLPDGDHAIVVHPVGNLAISFDHRAYDGAYASAFLARIREILETRDWSAEL